MNFYSQFYIKMITILHAVLLTITLQPSNPMSISALIPYDSAVTGLRIKHNNEPLCIPNFTQLLSALSGLTPGYSIYGYLMLTPYNNENYATLSFATESNGITTTIVQSQETFPYSPTPSSEFIISYAAKNITNGTSQLIPATTVTMPPQGLNQTILFTKSPQVTTTPTIDNYNNMLCAGYQITGIKVGGKDINGSQYKIMQDTINLKKEPVAIRYQFFGDRSAYFLVSTEDLPAMSSESTCTTGDFCALTLYLQQPNTKPILELPLNLPLTAQGEQATSFFIFP